MTRQAIATRLAGHLGLDIQSIGRLTVDTAITRRMDALLINQPQAYLDYIDQHQNEFNRLINQVIVPETWFFRNPEAFKLMVEHLKLHRDQTQRPIRLLSAPCATGEEPYSMAMALHMAHFPIRQFTIDAVDIAEQCLQRAARAQYRNMSFRGNEPRPWLKYFNAVPGTDLHQLCQTIQSTVRFHHMNLARPHALPDAATYDIIFCRNLMIYLTPEARQRLVLWLCQQLSDTGLLFIGHAETAILANAPLQPVPQRLTFAFQRTSPDRQITRTPDKPVNRTAPLRHMHETTRQTTTTKTDNRRKNPTPSPDIHLAEARRLANTNQPRAALILLEQLVHSHPTAELFCLMGTLHSMLQQDLQATQAFEKAVYLDPYHHDALVHLAILYRQAGHHRQAEQFQRRAGQTLKQDSVT